MPTTATLLVLFHQYESSSYKMCSDVELKLFHTYPELPTLLLISWSRLPVLINPFYPQLPNLSETWHLYIMTSVWLFIFFFLLVKQPYASTGYRFLRAYGFAHFAHRGDLVGTHLGRSPPLSNLHSQSSFLLFYSFSCDFRICAIMHARESSRSWSISRSLDWKPVSRKTSFRRE